MDTWWKQNYTTPPNSGLYLDTMETCRRFIQKNLGWSILPYTDWSTLPTIYASNRYIGTMEQRLNAKQISTIIRANRSAKLFKLLLIMYSNTYDQANLSLIHI